MDKPKVLVIVGPTASGKTATAVAVAKKINGEIISADSMQIYQEMNIGTAKPTVEEMDGVPHHMLDCVAPDTPYSVADYVITAEQCIEAILDRGHIPIVCGGTGLYINGLTLPWSFEDNQKDDDLRHRLEVQAKTEGVEVLYDRLQQIDPITAEQLHPNNVKRVIRALEIYELTGRPKSEWDAEAKEKPLPYDYIMTGLQWDRAVLYERIDQRVDDMLAAGLLNEAETLLAKGYTTDLISMKAIGYKELFPYLEGGGSLEETVRILKRDTRHFAKRQLTWFRKDERIRWFVAEEFNSVNDLAQAVADHFTETVRKK